MIIKYFIRKLRYSNKITCVKKIIKGNNPGWLRRETKRSKGIINENSKILTE